MILQTWELTDAEVKSITAKNAELIALRNLCKELTEVDANVDFLFTKLASAQLSYDMWFTEIALAKEINTQPINRWNVEFAAKQLQLLDK